MVFEPLGGIVAPLAPLDPPLQLFDVLFYKCER